MAGASGTAGASGVGGSGGSGTPAGLTVTASWPNGAILTGVRDVASPAVTQIVTVHNGGSAESDADRAGDRRNQPGRLQDQRCPTTSSDAGARRQLAADRPGDDIRKWAAGRPCARCGGNDHHRDAAGDRRSAVRAGKPLRRHPHDRNARSDAWPDLAHARLQAERRVGPGQRESQQGHSPAATEDRAWHRRDCGSLVQEGPGGQRDALSGRAISRPRGRCRLAGIPRGIRPRATRSRRWRPCPMPRRRTRHAWCCRPWTARPASIQAAGRSASGCTRISRARGTTREERRATATTPIRRTVRMRRPISTASRRIRSRTQPVSPWRAATCSRWKKRGTATIRTMSSCCRTWRSRRNRAG